MPKSSCFATSFAAGMTFIPYGLKVAKPEKHLVTGAITAWYNISISCRWAQVPRICAGGDVRYSPSMRASPTARRRGTCDHLTGKTGYQPACANEWIRDLCDKRRTKCVNCPNRRFLPLSDEVIHRHLIGRDANGRDFVSGVYPMLLDETCFLLAVDFDKASWRNDSAAFMETCCELDVPTALERSRSGNGGHVWFFFKMKISEN